MNRIDVVESGKKFKVLINFIQRGIDYSSATLANQEAIKIHAGKTHITLNLFKKRKTPTSLVSGM
jgi:hypothetical protein